MATAKFIIKDKKLNKYGEATIYVQYTHESKNFLVSTQVKVEPKFWNKEDMKFRNSYDSKKKVRDEGLIKKKLHAIEGIYQKLQLDDVNPTTQRVKAKYEEQMEAMDEQKEEENPSQSFFDLFDLFIETNKTTKVKGTIGVYKSTKSRLQEFQTKKKFKLGFDKMDRKFYDQFCHYLFEDHKVNTNTAGKHIKTLKTFLNYAVELEQNVNPYFHKFKVLKEEVEIIYLTDQELRQLLVYDFRGNKRLEHVRDVFCFCCFTGLRFSDVQTLTSNQIYGDSLLVNTRKTKDQLRIHLLPQAKAILDKYAGKYHTALPAISNQKTNQYLKEIGQLVGIDAPVTTIQYYGSKRIKQTTPKYEKLSSHIARKTFVTLALEKGMRPEVVMRITGHKDFKAMRPYIKIVDSVVADEMRKAWS